MRRLVVISCEGRRRDRDHLPQGLAGRVVAG
jgi:hypothetical protein